MCWIQKDLLPSLILHFNALICIRENGSQMINFAERKPLGFSDSKMLAGVGKKTFQNNLMCWIQKDWLPSLISHFNALNCVKQNGGLISSFTRRENVYKYIPVKAIYERLPLSVIKHMISFHAVEGCDTTSFISRHTKRQLGRCFWKVPACLQMLVLELWQKMFSPLLKSSSVDCILLPKQHLQMLRDILFFPGEESQKICKQQVMPCDCHCLDLLFMP